MPQLDIPGGISLSYFSYPDPIPSPSRPTLLFLSALFQKAEIQFEPQLRDTRLAGDGAEGFAFNFVGIDVHGHGDTTGRDTWDYEDNARDVVTAMVGAFYIHRYIVLRNLLFDEIEISRSGQVLRIWDL